MKKFGISFIMVLVLMFISFSISPAIACQNCRGKIHVDAHAKEGVVNSDAVSIHNGAASGISGAYATSGGEGNGCVKKGKLKEKIDTTAGALTVTDSSKYKLSNVDDSKGVYSNSFSESIIQTDAKVKLGKYSKGHGYISFDGFGAEGTLNGSYIQSTRKFETSGESFGIAGQGAIGVYDGSLNVSGRCYRCCHKESTASASVDMYGSSYSGSYRYRDTNGRYYTEGFGTNVGVSTIVNSSKAARHARVDGGWVAAGGAVAHTIQEAEGGMARATAGGAYMCSGPLGSNFKGSVDASTATSITSVAGLHGSVNTASSSVTVTTSKTR